MLAVLLTLTTAQLPADGSRIVFFGDSITQDGRYVEYVEAFLLTRYPERSYGIVNAGISSQTVSGLSEPDHPTPRFNALDRFDRDVAGQKPDVVVACFGMNDGIYHPLGEDRFEAYRDGIRTLIAKTRGIGAELHLLTPPPYDPYRRQVGDPKAKSYGYRFPAVDYDRTLAAYAEWLRSLDQPGVTVVPLNSDLQRWLDARRVGDVGYSFSPDGVHPDATGHWLMAQSLLTAWGVAPQWATAEDAPNLSRDGDDIHIEWSVRTPMAYDPSWDDRMLAVCGMTETLNAGTLAIPGLEPATDYELTAGDRNLGTFTGTELAAGVEVDPRSLPTLVQRSRFVLEDVQRRRRTAMAAWVALAKPSLEPVTAEQLRDIGALPAPHPNLHAMRQPTTVTLHLSK